LGSDLVADFPVRPAAVPSQISGSTPLGAKRTSRSGKGFYPPRHVRCHLPR
jgi:hypothetical protein